MSDERKLTRREVLKSATLVGASAATPTLLPIGELAAAEAPYTNLSASEAKLLEAIVDRLIPADSTGPGALDAGVTRYIDRALGDALAASRSGYVAGLASLDRYAIASRGKPFLELPVRDQDSVLIDCETGGATGFPGSSAQFFGMVLNHTRQGMFGDPYYGGNKDGIGWDLIGYPGLRLGVAPADQAALEAGELSAQRRSAYDFGAFHEASKDGSHGR